MRLVQMPCFGTVQIKGIEMLLKAGFSHCLKTGGGVLKLLYV
jgi:hypothetical protein